MCAEPPAFPAKQTEFTTTHELRPLSANLLSRGFSMNAFTSPTRASDVPQWSLGHAGPRAAVAGKVGRGRRVPVFGRSRVAPQRLCSLQARPTQSAGARPTTRASPRLSPVPHCRQGSRESPPRPPAACPRSFSMLSPGKPLGPRRRLGRTHCGGPPRNSLICGTPRATTPGTEDWPPGPS